MKKFTILLITVSFALFACNRERNYEKELQKTCITNYFENSELKDLSDLMVEFENNIYANDKSINLQKKYIAFCSELEKEKSSLDFNNKIQLLFQDNKKTNQLISNETYKKIWKIEIGRINNSNSFLDTTLSLRTDGAYVDFLKDYANKNPFVKEYLNSLIIAGDMSPAMVATMQKEWQKLNFNEPLDRLILAVHYFTIAEMLSRNKGTPKN